ncbi:MAG: DUF1573 domain-containing protein [Bacteroidota bacterium]|nr:DUF1573 domain-containing protein [Bacteroidota bacterium]
MKYIFITLIGSILFFACENNDGNSTGQSLNDSAKHAQMLNAVSDSTNYTSIQWIDSTHQALGKVQEGQIVEITWHFKNTGNKPLIITNTSASCGCTVAEKPEAPVAPGNVGIIKAKFDSNGREGMQRKDVFVTANTNNTTNHQLSFSLEVQKK